MTTKPYGLSKGQETYNQALNEYFNRPSDSTLNNLKVVRLESGIADTSLIEDIAKRHITEPKVAEKDFKKREIAIQTQMKSTRVDIEPVGQQKGLSNLGNTCWGNATLQAFVLSNPTVQQLINTPLPLSAPNRAAREAFRTLLKDLNDEYSKVSPGQMRISTLLTQVWTSDILKSSNLRPMISQEDAPEFLEIILDTLDAGKNGRISFEERSALQVTGQATTSHKSDRANQIIKAKGLGAKPTVQKTIDRMFTPENLEGYKFNGKETPAKKTIYYSTIGGSAPTSLAVQLPRFAFDNAGKKVTTPIKGFDQEIRVPFHDDKGNLVKHGVYQVDSVVLHLGTTLKGGHYLTLVRTDRGWEERNDSFVRSVTTQEAHRMMEEHGYLVRMTRVREELSR